MSPEQAQWGARRSCGRGRDRDALEIIRLTPLLDYGTDPFSEEFREKLAELIDVQMGERKRSSYSGEEADEHDERMAEALVRAGLKVLGLDEAEVLAGRKGTDEKCLLAWLVRRRTSVTNEWISRRLKMGRPDCLSRYPQRIEETRDRRLLQLRGRLDNITILRD